MLLSHGLIVLKKSHKYHFIRIWEGGKLHVCVRSSILNPGNVCLYFFNVYFSVADLGTYVANIYENLDRFLFSGNVFVSWNILGAWLRTPEMLPLWKMPPSWRTRMVSEGVSPAPSEQSLWHRNTSQCSYLQLGRCTGLQTFNFEILNLVTW